MSRTPEESLARSKSSSSRLGGLLSWMSPFRHQTHGQDQELAEDRPNQIESGSSYNETPSKMLPSASSQALPRVTDFDMPRTESTSALSQWNGDLPVRRSLRTPNTEKVASSANESDVGSYAQLPNHNTGTHNLSIIDPSPISQRVSFGSPSPSPAAQSQSRRAPIPQSSSLTSISPFASSPGRRHQPIYFGAGTSPRRPSRHSPYRSPIATSNSIDESKRRKFESSANAAIPVQFASPSSTSMLRSDASLKDSTPTRKRAAPGSSQRADDALRSIRAAVDVQVREPANPTQTETSSPSSSSSATSPRPTRAASTMLTVLESSSPRIHTPPVPEVVNPYQTRSRASPKPATPQSTRAKALEAARHRASSSLSSSTARDTDAPPSTSLLDMVQRTAPLSPSTQKHRSSLAHSTDQDPSSASQNSAESLDPPKIAWQHKPKRPSPLAMSEQSNNAQKTASTNSDQPSQWSSQKPINASFQLGESQSSTNIASNLISKESSSNIPSSTESPTLPMASAAEQQTSSANSSGFTGNPAKPSFSFSSAPKPRNDVHEQPVEATKDTLPKTQQFSFGTQANVTPKQAAQEPSSFLFEPKSAAASMAPNAQTSATAPSATTPAAATLSKDQKAEPSFSNLPWLHILPPSHPRPGPSNDAIAKAAAIAYEQLPAFVFDVADALPVSLEELTEDNISGNSPSLTASTETHKDTQKRQSAPFNEAVKQIAKEPFRDADAAKDQSSSQSFTTSAAKDKPSTNLNPGKPAGFAFGQASMPSSDATATENSSSKSFSGFSFRPPASSQSSSGFSFGKPQEEESRSEPKPSFSFLTPTTTSATPSSTQPKFSFGNASKAPSTFAPSAFASSASAPSTSTSSELSTETMRHEPPETDPAAATPPPNASQDNASDENTFTSSGQGEEDEETKHEVRAKIWKLDEGKWQDLGITVFRLKYNSSTNKTRVLARNAVNGNVVLNFHLYSGMKVTCEKTIVSFVGMIDAKPCSLRCKVKTNQAADALTQAINSHLP